MKVRANTDGFYGGRRYRQGSVFVFNGVKPGSWMDPIDAPVSKPVTPEPAPVDTLSALNKEQAAVEDEGVKRKSAKA